MRETGYRKHSQNDNTPNHARNIDKMTRDPTKKMVSPPKKKTKNKKTKKKKNNKTNKNKP